jgi:hypothetical protein
MTETVFDVWVRCVDPIVGGDRNVWSSPRRLLRHRASKKTEYRQPPRDLHTASAYSRERQAPINCEAHAALATFALTQFPIAGRR